MSETLIDPLLGRLIDGRYEVRERVAAGGMATVYVAFDKRLERDVALKIMHQHLAADASEADFVSRFRREAKSAARLTHPGMVRVYDQGVDGDLSYLTMEYVDGENLRERVTQEGTLAVGEALAITDAVLDALAAAHRQGLVHRDVKPENVLLDESGRPKLADFGLARAVTEVTSTSTGMLLGTVAYLAPELVADGDADARADVYSCGILLYEMVTGRQPFTAETALGVASRHVHEDMPAPSATVPWLPVEFDELVAVMTARDPQGRPADAAAALVLVRHARSLIDDPTLDRRAEPPSGAVPIVHDDGATTVLSDAPSGSTIALPIGLGGAAALVAGGDAEILDDDPDAIEPERPNRRTGWWIGAVLATLVVLGGLGLWWYTSIGPGAYTTVPSVQSQTEADATASLEALGFVVTTDEEFDDVIAEGIAIGTDPQEQARLLNGSDITLIVSQGARQETIPEVVGLQESEALAALGDAGFPVGDPTFEYSDTIPEGEVMASTPAQGETVRHDKEVSLELSDGPAPITIPDVVGSTESAAIDALEEDALVVTVERERTPDAPKGEVFRQNPEAGADGIRTQEVTIWVSDGPPLVELSDYTFNTVERARDELEGLGLNVNLEADNPWPWTTPEFVVGQRPAAGTQLEVGSTVTLVYDS
ncbi:Stk1 family PASTA domain-containing Ser/Thr kinase [Demequina muriae]|uniref:non-specific serine/threonine protein kinase n=1 Tax=Demequina muriae TaxID=3051664 RepID=A0ABT8GJL3_9MICO|nr:Stk1 family PASTA domain-containing Ser/Thr kinase [Demequina sp. EGI L300058]MDN4481569.1 Stk1 family PASTA domain-containing Ser/Thr kinase [Demequina sp. EGI L300058]